MKTLFLLFFVMVLQNDWVPFSSKDCTILFPKKPVDSQRTIPSAIGPLKITLHLYQPSQGQQDDNYSYALGETEYPDTVVNSGMKSKLDKFFDDAAKGAINNIHGKLISVVRIQINGFPGREIRGEASDGSFIMTMRAYLVKNKMYSLGVITAKTKSSNASIGRFLNSFELK
jgi:hypothetical protein